MNKTKRSHSDSRMVSTVASFVHSIVTLKERVANGEHVAITYRDQIFYAVPFSETNSLIQGQLLDVTPPTGRTSISAPTRKFNFTERTLASILNRVTDKKTESISFGSSSDKAISFVTAKANERIVAHNQKIRLSRPASVIVEPTATDVANNNSLGTLVSEEPKPRQSTVVEQAIAQGKASAPKTALADALAAAAAAKASAPVTEPIVVPSPKPQPAPVSAAPAPVPAAVVVSPVKDEPESEEPGAIAPERIFTGDAAEDKDMGRVLLRQGGLARYNDEILGNAVAECLSLYRHRIVGVTLSMERAEKMGIPEADRQPLATNAIAWKTNFREYAYHNSLREVSGIIAERDQKMFYATIGYIKAHANLFADALDREDMAEVNAEWLHNVAKLTTAYWAKENSISSTYVHAKRASFIDAVNNYADLNHTGDFEPGKIVALTNRTLVKALVLAGGIVRGEPHLHALKLGDFGEGWEDFKKSNSPDTVLVFSNGAQKITIVKPDFGLKILPLILAKSPAISDMIETVSPRKVKTSPRVAPIAFGTANVAPVQPDVAPVQAPIVVDTEPSKADEVAEPEIETPVTIEAAEQEAPVEEAKASEKPEETQEIAVKAKLKIRNGKALGIMMPVELMDKIGISSEDRKVISTNFIRWDVRLGENGSDHRVMQPVSGIVADKKASEGDIEDPLLKRRAPFFFANLGYVHANPERFVGLLDADGQQTLDASINDSIRTLVVDYVGKTNTLPLAVFNQRRKTIVDGVNGEANTHPDNKFTPGTVLALTARREVAALAFAGKKEDRDGGDVIETDYDRYPEHWRHLREAFPADMILSYSASPTSHMSIISPNPSARLVKAMLKFLPSVADMSKRLEVLNAEPVVVAEPKVKKPEPAVTITPPVELVAPPVKPLAPAFKAPAAPEGAVAKASLSVGDGMSILQKVMAMNSILKDLRLDANMLLDTKIGDNPVLGLGANKVANVEDLVALYEDMKSSDEPSLQYSVVDFNDTDGGAKRAGVLKEAFDATKDSGKVVILRAGRETTIVGDNPSFTEFVRVFV